MLFPHLSDSRRIACSAAAYGWHASASVLEKLLRLEAQGLLLRRAFLNKARPLWIRDITVPIGISRILAISS